MFVTLDRSQADMSPLKTEAERKPDSRCNNKNTTNKTNANSGKHKTRGQRVSKTTHTHNDIGDVQLGTGAAFYTVIGESGVTKRIQVPRFTTV